MLSKNANYHKNTLGQGKSNAVFKRFKQTIITIISYRLTAHIDRNFNQAVVKRVIEKITQTSKPIRVAVASERNRACPVKTACFACNLLAGWSHESSYKMLSGNHIKEEDMSKK
jgi:hypothetical protein